MPAPYPLRRTFEKKYFIETDPSAEITGQTEEDREWLWIIPGKYGHVYIFGSDRLGVYMNRPPTSARGKRLLAIVSAKPHQMGDKEFAVTIDPADVGGVAPILGLRKRPRLTEEEIARRTAQILANSINSQSPKQESF